MPDSRVHSKDNNAEVVKNCICETDSILDVQSGLTVSNSVSVQNDDLFPGWGEFRRVQMQVNIGFGDEKIDLCEGSDDDAANVFNEADQIVQSTVQDMWKCVREEVFCVGGDGVMAVFKKEDHDASVLIAVFAKHIAVVLPMEPPGMKFHDAMDTMALGLDVRLYSLSNAIKKNDDYGFSWAVKNYLGIWEERGKIPGTAVRSTPNGTISSEDMHRILDERVKLLKSHAEMQQIKTSLMTKFAWNAQA